MKTKTTTTLHKSLDEWALCRWEGDIVPSSLHKTQMEAIAHAKNRGWCVKRMPELDLK